MGFEGFPVVPGKALLFVVKCVIIKSGGESSVHSSGTSDCGHLGPQQDHSKPTRAASAGHRIGRLAVSWKEAFGSSWARVFSASRPRNLSRRTRPQPRGS